MGFRIDGLNDLQRKLESLAANARALDGTHTVSISEVLTPEFLSAHSRFNSVEAFFDASGFKVETQEDFKAIPDEQWDAFIQQNTDFANWKDMLHSASAAWTKKKLGL